MSVIDVNHFGPFDPEVWGTFSDWIMIAVTAGTGFLLWRSLESQLSILKIEDAKHRQAVMPIFEIDITNGTEVNTSLETVHILLKLKLSIINSQEAKAVNLRYIGNKWQHHTAGHFPIDVLDPKDALTLKFSTTRDFPATGDENMPLIFMSFELCFCDIVDRNYYQTVNVFFSKGQQKIEYTQPSPISRYIPSADQL